MMLKNNRNMGMNEGLYCKMQIVEIVNWAPYHGGVWGSEGLVPCILNIGSTWVSGQLVPQPLYPQEKRPWYLVHWRLGWPQSQSICFKGKSFCLCWESKHDYLVIGPL